MIIFYSRNIKVVEEKKFWWFCFSLIKTASNLNKATKLMWKVFKYIKRNSFHSRFSLDFFLYFPSYLILVVISCFKNSFICPLIWLDMLSAHLNTRLRFWRRLTERWIATLSHASFDVSWQKLINLAALRAKRKND